MDIKGIVLTEENRARNVVRCSNPFIYINSQNDSIRERKPWGWGGGRGGGRKGEAILKRAAGATGLNVDCGGHHTNPHVIKLPRTKGTHAAQGAQVNPSCAGGLSHQQRLDGDLVL
jgi:hypothetical protein